MVVWILGFESLYGKLDMSFSHIIPASLGQLTWRQHEFYSSSSPTLEAYLISHVLTAGSVLPFSGQRPWNWEGVKQL